MLFHVSSSIIIIIGPARTLLYYWTILRLILKIVKTLPNVDNGTCIPQNPPPPPHTHTYVYTHTERDGLIIHYNTLRQRFKSYNAEKKKKKKPQLGKPRSWGGWAMHYPNHVVSLYTDRRHSSSKIPTCYTGSDTAPISPRYSVVKVLCFCQMLHSVGVSADIISFNLQKPDKSWNTTEEVVRGLESHVIIRRGAIHYAVAEKRNQTTFGTSKTDRSRISYFNL